ncbi:MAG: hypothetical protein V4591_08030 [Bdellovibrionota bacterium]
MNITAALRTNVHHALLKKGIDIQKQTIQSISLPESVTNSYFQLENMQGEQYLIRKNGVLWPPFSRQDEAFHLNALAFQGIETNVVVNNPQSGFQISRLYHEDYSMSHWGQKLEDAYTDVAKNIHHCHTQVRNYRGTYPLSLTIYSSFKKLLPEQRKALQNYYELMMKIANAIENDYKNQVFSHNDLWPSSIYRVKNQIILVDWEYAGGNHRAFDLAFVVLKNKFSSNKEASFIKSYSHDHYEEKQYFVDLLKPVLSFMEIQWKIPKFNGEIPNDLFLDFKKYLYHAVKSYMYSGIKGDLVISLVKTGEMRKRVSSKRLPTPNC